MAAPATHRLSRARVALETIRDLCPDADEIRNRWNPDAATLNLNCPRDVARLLRAVDEARQIAVATLDVFDDEQLPTFIQIGAGTE